MMADVPAAARQIAVPDEPAAWERLGFAVGEDGAFALGDVVIATGRPRFEVAVDGLATNEPDTLPLVPAAAPPDRRTPPGYGDAPPEGRTPRAHPNAALAVDHVVAFTDRMDRTLAALETAGLELRRVREPPEAPARQAFLRLGAADPRGGRDGDARPVGPRGARAGRRGPRRPRRHAA